MHTKFCTDLCSVMHLNECIFVAQYTKLNFFMSFRVLPDLDVFTGGASLLAGMAFCPFGVGADEMSVPLADGFAFLGVDGWAPFFRDETLFLVVVEVSAATGGTG